MKAAPALAAACCVLCFACGFTPPKDSVLLPIPDRQWAPGAPPEGWCGETSIQMIGLHFGAWFPQPHAHALGKPKHVDLWETDMPTALTAAGLHFETFSGLKRPEADFLHWIIGHVRQGHPVIIGVKLLPDVHPESEIDHLMPVVGFTPAHLVVNTNLPQGQAPVPYAAIAAKKGVLLTTSTRKQFGWAVTGLDRSNGVSLRVVGETAQTVTLDVQTEARVVRLDDFRGTAQHVTLDGGPLQLPGDVPARFSSTAL